jgi:hypothetical protein
LPLIEQNLFNQRLTQRAEALMQSDGVGRCISSHWSRKDRSKQEGLPKNVDVAALAASLVLVQKSTARAKIPQFASHHKVLKQLKKRSD